MLGDINDPGVDTEIILQLLAAERPQLQPRGLGAADQPGHQPAEPMLGRQLLVAEEVAAEALPQGYQLAWTGTAYQEKVSGGASNSVFLLGVLMVFLILAAQFERWTLPLAVILAVPFAAFGAFLAVFLRGQENDIYFQIGMLTLVGLAAKNAILIVEFAMMKYHEGMPLAQAAVEGAKLRFRPIIMTSLAFILGMVPLVVSSGAGAASSSRTVPSACETRMIVRA